MHGLRSRAGALPFSALGAHDPPFSCAVHRPSHVPAAGCLIDHYCTDRREKDALRDRAIAHRHAMLMEGSEPAVVKALPLPVPSAAWFCKKNPPQLPPLGRLPK